MVLLPLGMQSLDLSILTATHFSFKQLLALYCSILIFGWFSLVPCWVSFPTPIHMLHSDLGCENHIISKMMAKHTTEIFCFVWGVWNATSIHLGFSSFQPWNPAENFTETAEIAEKNPLGKTQNFLFAESALISLLARCFGCQNN